MINKTKQVGSVSLDNGEMARKRVLITISWPLKENSTATFSHAEQLVLPSCLSYKSSRLENECRDQDKVRRVRCEINLVSSSELSKVMVLNSWPNLPADETTASEQPTSILGISPLFGPALDRRRLCYTLDDQMMSGESVVRILKRASRFTTRISVFPGCSVTLRLHDCLLAPISPPSSSI